MNQELETTYKKYRNSLIEIALFTEFDELPVIIAKNALNLSDRALIILEKLSSISNDLDDDFLETINYDSLDEDEKEIVNVFYSASYQPNESIQVQPTIHPINQKMEENVGRSFELLYKKSPDEETKNYLNYLIRGEYKLKLKQENE
jgi:hypothetical protein